MPNDINQQSVEHLISDLKYLQDEAEALKYVIDSVPYDQQTPSGTSVIERLMFIDHAQHQYYREILEEAFKSPRPINLNQYSLPEESFIADPELASDIQKVLFKLSKHRAAILNLVEKIPLIDWERTIKAYDSEINLYEFIVQMVKEERKVFKEIADLVMSHQKDLQHQREIKKGH
jgi:hypothetical protein